MKTTTICLESDLPVPDHFPHGGLPLSRRVADYRAAMLSKLLVETGEQRFPIVVLDNGDKRHIGIFCGLTFHFQGRELMVNKVIGGKHSDIPVLCGVLVRDSKSKWSFDHLCNIDGDKIQKYPEDSGVLLSQLVVYIESLRQ